MKISTNNYLFAVFNDCTLKKIDIETRTILYVRKQLIYCRKEVGFEKKPIEFCLSREHDEYLYILAQDSMIYIVKEFKIIGEKKLDVVATCIEMNDARNEVYVGTKVK